LQPGSRCLVMIVMVVFATRKWLY